MFKLLFSVISLLVLPARLKELTLENLALRQQLWHRRGFRLFWTWIFRRKRSGRPGISRELRNLVCKMVEANPLWGAPRNSRPLPAARPGQNLWRGVSAANSKPRCGGGPLRAGQPLAAGVCGEADRIHSTRLLRLRDHSGRKASPGHPEKLPQLLSPEPDSLSAR